ncbi:MAG: hypothetical protein WC796_03395 [Candidatus Pacearchaeota archaeon]|jgi:ribosomal RNA assembly protein
MKSLYIKSARKILSNKLELEKKLKVKISVSGTTTTIEGNETDEYFAERVLLALDFPFTLEEALLLINENYMFEKINIKSHTHRKDLNTIKARLIGTKGKTLRVLEDLSDSLITVKDNNVAIISPAEDAEKSIQAIISIIKGSKQANVYARLEKARKQQK